MPKSGQTASRSRCTWAVVAFGVDEEIEQWVRTKIAVELKRQSETADAARESGYIYGYIHQI
jgi:hypothetical protein